MNGEYKRTGRVCWFSLRCIIWLLTSFLFSVSYNLLHYPFNVFRMQFQFVLEEVVICVTQALKYRNCMNYK